MVSKLVTVVKDNVGVTSVIPLVAQGGPDALLPAGLKASLEADQCLVKDVQVITLPRWGLQQALEVHLWENVVLKLLRLETHPQVAPHTTQSAFLFKRNSQLRIGKEPMGVPSHVLCC